MNVVLDGLPQRAAAVLSLEDAHLLRLALVKLEDDGEGHKDKRLDDGKRANGPAPGAVLEERLRGERAGKRRADEGRRSEPKGECTVTEARRVGHEDVENHVQRVVTNPIEDITGGIAIRSIARREDNHAEEIDTEENEVPLGAAPDVEGLGNWQLEDAADDVGQDRRGGDGRRRLEVGVRGKGCISQDALLQSQHEKADPDPVKAHVRTCNAFSGASVEVAHHA